VGSTSLYATILYMSTTVSLADARARFSQIVDAASSTHERFDVTRNGDRVAVVLGSDDFDALLETVDILSDRETVQAISVGLEEIDRGETYSVDEVRDAMAQAGRFPR
jgi:antitoxin YefM